MCAEPSKTMPKNYTSEDLIKAVGLVQRGEMTQGKASKTFSISPMTISDHVNGKVNLCLEKRIK